MYNYILEKLPYKSSFRFVDNITLLNEDGITGNYTLRKDAIFYEDHFPGYPITPGAILTEIMVQIGLVSLGIYIKTVSDNFNENQEEALFPLLTATNVSFYKMVLPGQKVTVISKKEYFRFNKLKCHIQMLDETGELIASGIFAGMIRKVNF